MINKKKIHGLIVCLDNLTVKEICKYTYLSEKEVNKHIKQLIKEYMATIGLFFGSDTGNTEAVTDTIQEKISNKIIRL